MSQPVVYLSEIEPEIVQVTMEDRASKNTFSDALVVGLAEAFKQIRENQNYKVVILTGYESFFNTGGNRDGLLAVYNKKAQYTDVDFSVALDCEIPVISAMQGHAIGGGFVFGLYADFVVLSEESIYTTNFMKYGFTPGMGSTYIMNKKLGFSLAEEMLIGARTYRGAELKERGVPFPVRPRKEVMPYAYELAQEVAEKTRESLVILKKQLVTPIREALPAVVEQELRMHSETFHTQTVKDRISEIRL